MEILTNKIKGEKSVPVSSFVDVLVLDNEPMLKRMKPLEDVDEISLFASLHTVDDVDGLRLPFSNHYLWPVWTEGEKLVFSALLEQLR